MGIKLDPEDKVEYFGALQRREKLAALLGQVASEWSLTESIMSVAYHVLLQAPIQISVDILDNTTNTKIKRDLVVHAAQVRFKSKKPDLYDKISRAAHDIQDAGDERNSYIHARWATCPKWKDKLIWVRRTLSGPKEFELKGEEDFKRLIDRIVKARNALHLLVGEIVEELMGIKNPSKGTIEWKSIEDLENSD